MTDPSPPRKASMIDKPVVVYGVSGYTWRLICNYLPRFKVPFVAGQVRESPLTVTS